MSSAPKFAHVVFQTSRLQAMREPNTLGALGIQRCARRRGRLGGAVLPADQHRAWRTDQGVPAPGRRVRRCASRDDRPSAHRDGFTENYSEEDMMTSVMKGAAR